MKFTDLFSGSGGIRLGFEQACQDLGVEPECVFARENDKNACLSYRENFGHDPSGDIRQTSSLPNHDFLLAGFPCQSFSYAGKQKGFSDTRGTLFFDLERLIAQSRPKFFLLENVRGLTSHDQGRTFQTIKDRLTGLGYSLVSLLLNSSNFGVPQNRVRVYILGSLLGPVKMTLSSNIKPSNLTSVSSILERQVAPRYYCSDDFARRLKKLAGNNLSVLNGFRLIDYRGGQSIHSWELGLKGDCTSEEISFMNLLIENRRKVSFGKHQDGKALTLDQIKTFYGGSVAVIDNLLRMGYLSCKDGKYNPVAGNMSFEVFKFLDPNKISLTLTASDADRLGIIQDNKPRRLTERECARLQGYPESYKLGKNAYRLMGNGVSVPVVRAVAKDFLTNNI